MSPKVCYLLTSPEKFQQLRGNGRCSKDSHTPTGKQVSAILRPKVDSFSESANLYNLALAGLLESRAERTMPNDGSGMSGEILTSTVKLLDAVKRLSLLKTLYQRTKSGR